MAAAPRALRVWPAGGGRGRGESRPRRYLRLTTCRAHRHPRIPLPRRRTRHSEAGCGPVQASLIFTAILLDFSESDRLCFQRTDFGGKNGDIAMSIKIPDELKADVPQTMWGKILSATPVVMTVVATLLAGLASSEMTHAQYSRALAAQQQSKTGDQWEFFQAKRLRSALQLSTLDVLQNTTAVRALDAATRASFTPPPPPARAPLDAPVQAAIDAVEAGRPEVQVTALVAKVNDQTLDAALRAAQERASAFDAAVRPANKVVEQLENESAERPNHRDVVAARLRYMAQRYDTESRLNQAIAYLYELQVRKSNFTAERHERRSQRFFFGMLTAQAAVIIATFAIAARKRNLLWSLAAAAGLAAVGFAVYVYLFI